VCSTDPSPIASTNVATMQYEDFCGDLFVKNNDTDQYTYEAATFEANIMPEVLKSAKKSRSSRSSYRKSRSGMYKIDLQSSILEMDDCNHTESVNKLNFEKLDTITECLAIITEPIIKLPVVAEDENLNKKVEDIEEIIKIDDFDYYEMDGEKRGVGYYRQLVVEETEKLNECSSKWDFCINEAPEDGMHDVTYYCISTLYFMLFFKFKEMYDLLLVLLSF
jgi:hypothetical protein